MRDPTGAVVTGATVKATNQDTNIEQTTATNQTGFYRFAGLEPGVYSIEFTASGFEIRRVQGIQVSAAQDVTLDQTLAVAGTQTVVEVVDSPAGVELAKTTATIERTLNAKFVENVPLTAGTRDLTTLALLAPNVNRAPGSTGFSASGQRARNNNFLLDGTDNNDASVTIAGTRIIPEAVSEVQVQTTAYSAEFGRNSGAQFSAITRSGTNRFHGDAWDYYSGNSLEPLNLLNKRAGLTDTPRFVQNQAGGAIGGPIVKNKTFFFGLVETNRRREARDARNATPITIPTPTGFQALRSVPLGPNQTTESRQAVLNAIGFFPEIHAQIPRFDSVRNINVNGVPIEVGTARIPLANPHNFWQVVGRVDHQLTSGNRLNYRFLIDDRDQPNVVSNLGFGERFAGSQDILGQNHAWGWTSTPKPNFINEFRFAYSRRNLDFPENDPNSPTTNVAGFFTLGGLANFPQGRLQQTFQFQNVSTWVLGRHSLRFGADIRRLKLFNRADFDSKGTFTFPTFADFINNNPLTITQALNTATFDARQWQTYFFVQDDLKLTRDLTVNIGFRYEYNDIPFGFFGATDPAVRAVGVPGPVRTDRNNAAPRGGLAWSPRFEKNTWLGRIFGDGMTVFRGGYGISYDVLFFNILTVNASNFPRVVVSQINRPDTVNVFPRIATRVVTPTLDPLALFVNSPEDLQNPTTHFYSFSIQRQFSKNYIVEIGYNGSRSYHQIRQGQRNPGILTSEQAALVRETKNPNAIPGLQARRLNPNIGPRITIESTALADYNALFVKFDKRFANNFLVGANYTWSKTLSDNDESLGVAAITGSSPQVPQNFFDFRQEHSLSVFDRPHRFVAHYQWDSPWFKKSSSAVLRHILGDWSLTGFTEFQSGQPFTIRTGVDSGGVGTAASARPNFNPGGIFERDPVSKNLRTFRIPIDGRGIVTTPLDANGIPLPNSQRGGGTLGRNTFRGPGFRNWNLSVQKSVFLHEDWRLRFRADFINAFNQRNFGNPNAVMSSGSFGANTSNPGNRSILLSVKLSF